MTQDLTYYLPSERDQQLAAGMRNALSESKTLLCGVQSAECSMEYGLSCLGLAGAVSFYFTCDEQMTL